ncbi:MAG: ABC transporter permease [Deferribacteraceae bacterium]|jgi:ABC-type polysaccharide/polyol phosphate export permease|nr:ABC transporter permease [Deferribacteraceae bacterium]
MSLRKALSDIKLGVKNRHVWLTFGWIDIKLRYRRSTIGPFWITISIAVMVLSLGILYSQIFNQDIKVYLPFVGCGLILWFFISGLLNEGCTAFIGAEGQIKQIKQPLSLYVLRLLWRNIIVFLHNFLVIIIIVLYFKIFHWQIFLFIPMFLLICALFYFITMILGIVCARYRDIPQIVLTLTQVLMFITPVFWQKEFIAKHTWVTTVNPAFHMLELLRNPILGKEFPFFSLYFVIAMLFILAALAIFLMARYGRRISYWV